MAFLQALQDANAVFKIAPNVEDGVPKVVVMSSYDAKLKVEVSDAISGLGSVILDEAALLAHRKECQFVDDMTWAEFFKLFEAALRRCDAYRTKVGKGVIRVKYSVGRMNPEAAIETTWKDTTAAKYLSSLGRFYASAVPGGFIMMSVTPKPDQATPPKRRAATQGREGGLKFRR
eukprot:GEMP01028137.1.p1 GENE.GEMP01028137.1~~GEMP01028137.1.p1  ORF type:complete len:191 (+),score=28.47 GEMP01028137.1:49-573(+)